MSRYESIAAVILAAGEGKRMEGRIKQLLPWGRETLLARAVRQTVEAGFGRVLVVLGSHADIVGSAIAGFPVEVVFNESWQEGIASSVRAAVERLPEEFQAALFMPVDQPGITSEVLRRVADAYLRTGRPVVYARYGGSAGKQPVVFDRSLFPELLGLKQDVGGREVVRRHRGEALPVDVGDDLAGADIDTWEDYVRLLEEYGISSDEEV